MTVLLVLLGYLLVGFGWAVYAVLIWRKRPQLDPGTDALRTASAALVALFWPLLAMLTVAGAVGRLALLVTRRRPQATQEREEPRGVLH